MRVRASDGRIIRLTHFNNTQRHIAILLELQSCIPNMLIDARDEVTHTHRMIPVAQINLEASEVCLLNPQ